MQPIPLHGCRHDVLGHYLKSVGLLRALALCAEPKHRDPDAEGWWDLGQACFVLRSSKYASAEALVEFFGNRYRPTPVFSAWNTGGGLDEKKQVVFTIDPRLWHEYWTANRDALLEHGFPPPADNATPPFPEKAFPLRLQQCSLPSTDEIEVAVIAGSGRGKSRVRISWSQAACEKLFAQMEANREILERGIKFIDAVKKKFTSGKPEFEFDVMDESAFIGLSLPGVHVSMRVKESGKKAVMARVEKELATDDELIKALKLGRDYFDRFQRDDADSRMLLEQYRDVSTQFIAEAFDAIFTTRASGKPTDNPVFLRRGAFRKVNLEVFREFWVSFLETREAVSANTRGSLFGDVERGVAVSRREGKGSPFFPDVIKSYNVGSGWIEKEYPFFSLDYLLAVEGAFAFRGSVARTLGASTRRFAAFPFVFDSAEDMLNDDGEVVDT